MRLNPDFAFENHGSVWLVHPLSARAAAWLRDHVVTSETQFFGNAVVVESRYVQDIHAAVFQQGFCIACHRAPAQH